MNSIWYSVRRNGVAIQNGWIDNLPLNRIREHVSAKECDVVEVCVAKNFSEITDDRFSKIFIQRARGLVGIEITYRNKMERYAPTTMMASNLSFGRAIEKFITKHSINSDQFYTQATFRVFSAKQYLIFGNNQRSVHLYRGSTLVQPTSKIDSQMITNLADGIAQWMITNLSKDGEIPYKYWPSRGEYSCSDNAIRRFLTTIALARYGKLKRDHDIMLVANRNLRFNLSRYYQQIDNHRGAIVEKTGVKLGASALAALAIIECEAGKQFNEHLNKLSTGIHSLVDKDMGFRTFFFPAQRDGENWNFYSGEALLFWAKAMRHKTHHAPSISQFQETASTCRKLHRKRRNPAFIPWHVQACVSFIATTGCRKNAPFVFEISDWLLSMQQWDGLTRDLQGRFYNPKHPEFGPPHAASTGAYLEGFADALWLARKFEDRRREKAFEQTINRGFRSLRQLQFRDENDAFYVSKKHRVMGSIRTEVYDNTIRTDSNAHALLAAVKVLQLQPKR